MIRYSVGKVTVEATEFAERFAYRQAVQDAKVEITLGSSVEGSRVFYLLNVFAAFNLSGWNDFAIAIESEGHGTTPNVLLLSSRQEMWIGFDTEVVIVDLMSRTARCRIVLDGLFRAFYCCPHGDSVVILHELGAAMLLQNGSQRWNYSKDIVESAQVEEDELVLDFIDSDRVRIDLVSGTVLPQ